jgi:hypothetical protein
MRSSMWIRAFAALLFTVVPSLSHAATAATPMRNLLLNPGFERGMQGHEWMPANWDTSDAGISTVFFGRDTLSHHSGQYSVNIANTSTVWAFNHNWRQVVLVGKEAWGKTAVFSIWTKSVGVDGRAYILVQAYRDTLTRMAVIWGVDRDEARRRMMVAATNDPILNLGWKRESFDDAETPWVRREVRVRVPESVNAIYVRGGLCGTGQVLFDDASLTLVNTPAVAPVAANTNLLTDPGFESRALAWEWLVPPFEGARIDRDSTVHHGGGTSMRCSDMAQGYTPSRMGMMQALDGRTLRGRHVRVSAWFKGDSLSSAVVAKVYSDTQHGTEQSGAGAIISGTFDWTYNSLEFDIPKDAEVVWPYLVFEAPAHGLVWMDDAGFEVLGSGTSAEAAAAPAPVGKKTR